MRILAHRSGATNDFLAHHGAHILMLVGPVVLVAGMLTLLELTRPDRRTRGSDVWTWWLAFTWAMVATVHLAVTVEHYGESAVHGTFFLVLGLAQGGYAVAVVVRASRRLLLAGMITHLSVVLLWAYTRAVAIPFGLGPPEPAGVADLLAAVLELGTVVLTWLALRRPPGSAADTLPAPPTVAFPISGQPETAPLAAHSRRDEAGDNLSVSER